jgi:hypothetical protein
MGSNGTAGEIGRHVDGRPSGGGLVTIPAQAQGWVRWLVWCASACAPLTLVLSPYEAVRPEGRP